MIDEFVAHICEADYLADNQLAMFRSRLERERADIELQEQAIASMGGAISAAADPLDRASMEAERVAAIKASKTLAERKSEIDAALRRIEAGEYGYCEESGERIGVRRLDAAPAARYSVEVQERHEREARLRRQ